MALAYKHVLSISGSDDEKGPKYTIVYDIRTTDDLDGPGSVGDYAGWSYGDPYAWGNESDSRAKALRITVEPVGSSKRHWRVTVEFGDPGLERPDNPLAEPPKVEWSWEDRQYPTLRDVNGTPILNPAGDRYDEIFYADDFRRKLSITRNEASFNRVVADQLGNRLNASPWRGYAAKTVKCHPINARDEYNSFVGQYWVVQYEFTFAPIASDWKRPIVETGIHEIVTGTKRRIKDDDGNAVSVPVPLTAAGVKLATGGSPVIKEWELLYTANFALLNLDAVDLD